MNEMEKRKSGQRSPLRRFYDDYILQRQDFRFAIERDPEEIIEGINKLWRRDDKYYELQIRKSEDEQVWQLEISDRTHSTEAQARLYHKDGLSIMEGTAGLKDFTPLLFVMLGTILLMAMVTSSGIAAFAVVAICFFVLGILGRFIVLRDHQRLIKFLDRVMTREENRLETEWEKEYKKEKISGK